MKEIFSLSHNLKTKDCTMHVCVWVCDLNRPPGTQECAANAKNNVQQW